MLSKFSVKKPFTIFVAVIIVIVFGCISLSKMTPDLFPEINTPYVIVMTTYPGASPEEVEKQVTEPMEQSLATLSNMKNLNSISADNYSIINIEFTDDVNMDAVSLDIRERIDLIEGALPENIGTPVIMKINLDMMPVVVAAVSMEDKSSGEVSRYTEEELMDKLKGVEGVAAVSSMGMIDDGLQIVLSQKKIDALNDKISDAVLSQFSDGESQINSGISQAKNADKKLNSGKKKAAKETEKGLKKLDSAIVKLQAQKEELLLLKSNEAAIRALVQQYQTAQQTQDAATLAALEEAMKQMGFNTPEEFMATAATLDYLDDSIKSINDAIEKLEKQKSAISVQSSSAYSDLSSTQSTITSTINQLQSALDELQNSKDAALNSADMSGVLTMENISAILNAQNFSMPAGYVTDGEAEILVSVGDKIEDEGELENLVLFNLDIDGVDPIRVKDLGKVTSVSNDNDTYARINGENGVLLSFTKQSSYATATVADNINEEFEKLEGKTDGLHFTTLMDQGEYIHIVIQAVLRDLLLGAILAILILLFFLRDIRPTIITGISIPVSVLFAVALMYFSNVSINMISLSGLAIGVGMLVDNSIVVIENIYRLRSLGYSKIQAAVSGAVQVGGAVTASTLTTICVFVPIIFIDGMTKDIFVDLALTVAYSLIASLLIALSLVPAMATGMLKRETKKSILGPNSRIIAKYKEIAKWALTHRKICMAGALVLLLLSGGIILVKGFEYMPAMSTPQISAEITMPEGSSLKDTTKVNDAIAEEMHKIDGVETVGAMLASDTLGVLGFEAVEQDVTETTMYIVMDEKKAENGKLVAKKLEELSEKYGCEIYTSANMDMTDMMGGSDIEINLFADDLDSLRKGARSVEKKLRKMGSVEEVSDVRENTSEELHISVDKNLAMEEGLTVAEVYQQIQQKLNKEQEAITINKAGENVDVNVVNTTKDKFTKKNLEDMNLTVKKQDGSTEKVSLSKIADIQTDASLNQITHDGQKRMIQITASVKDGYNVTKVTSQINSSIKRDNLVPSDVEVVIAGQNEDIMKAMKQMLEMLLVAMLLVYLIMVAQFQSLRSPFIIIFTIPLAFTGGLLGLIITNNVLSVVSMMGFVMLSGIVVNNAIVLVDTINRFRLEGMEMREAIISAGSVRMRPVLMTAATTVLGLLPLALGLGTGAEMVQPLAITSIGGLIYATVTTLVIIPVMYSLLGRKKMEKIKSEELEIVNV